IRTHRDRAWCDLELAVFEGDRVVGVIKAALGDRVIAHVLALISTEDAAQAVAFHQIADADRVRELWIFLAVHLAQLIRAYRDWARRDFQFAVFERYRVVAVGKATLPDRIVAHVLAGISYKLPGQAVAFHQIA